MVSATDRDDHIRASKGRKALELIMGRDRWQVHEKRHMKQAHSKVASWRKQRASGRGNICISLEATRSRQQCLDNSKYGSSLSPVQGRGVERDDIGQVAMKKRPCKQQEGVSAFSPGQWSQKPHRYTSTMPQL